MNQHITLNPYLTGISILLVQLGGRFLTNDFLPSQTVMFSNIYVKLLVIFFILLTSIQDMWYAMVLTIGYYVVVYILLHPQHPLSIMPESLKRYDLNGDGVITMQEIQSVIEREREGINRSPLLSSTTPTLGTTRPSTL